MRKTRIIAGLLTLLLITGCGAPVESDRSDDEDTNQVAENTPNSDSAQADTNTPDSGLTGEEDSVADSITQEQAMDMVYKYATNQMENVGDRKIAISYEGDVTLEAYNGDVCFSFRISEETDEQSLTLGFYAIGNYSRVIYQMDPVTGEFAAIGQVDFDGKLTGEGSNGVTGDNGGTSLDELVAAVQKSKALTFELTSDPGSRIPFPAEDMDYLMGNFTTENVKPADYPFLFIPEYRVDSETGVTFYIMNDDSASDFGSSVIQFDGSNVIYIADQSIYGDFVRLLSPSMEVKMAQMHVFANGADAASGIDAAVHANGVQNAALDYFTNSGYALASMMEEDIFRVDSYDVMDMTEVDPHLASVMINYSVKTASESEPDKWITNNAFVGAIWIDQRDAAARAYILGLEPYMADGSAPSQADITLSIYEKSLAKAMME